RIRLAAVMSDPDAHAPDEDPKHLAKRRGGAIISDDDARIRIDYDYAAVGQLDDDATAAARIDLLAGAQQVAAGEDEGALVVAPQSRPLDARDPRVHGLRQRRRARKLN